MPELKVPLAHDKDGLIVSPADAQKGNKHYCPNCGDSLILRKGEKKVAHFAHKDTDRCSNETIVHKLAKQIIADGINDYIKTRSESPIIKRLCHTCDWLTPQKLPERITLVSVEKKLKSGFIADVAIEANGDVVAAIEVKVTHGVTDEKQGGIDVPFIELDGEAILENPKVWIPILDKFKPFDCKKCAKALEEYEKILSVISEDTRISIPESYYRTGITECHSCHNLMLIFDWPEHEGYDQKAPKEPRPKTIQYKYSNTVRNKYWANTCPRCKALLGDFYLPMKFPPDYMSGSSDSIESFKADMRKIAVFYYKIRGLKLP